MSKIIFELTEITPVGFKWPSYPHPNCRLCRGPLIYVCSDCKEKNNEICGIMCDGTESKDYYHEHCHRNLLL